MYTGLRKVDSELSLWIFSSSWTHMIRLLCNDRRYSRVSSPHSAPPLVTQWSRGGLQNFHRRIRKRNAKEKDTYIEGSSPVLFNVGFSDPNASQRGIREAATVGTCKKNYCILKRLELQMSLQNTHTHTHKLTHIMAIKNILNQAQRYYQKVALRAYMRQLGSLK